MADADYLYAFEKIVLPIAYEFAPELVISKSASVFGEVQRVSASHQFQPDSTQRMAMSLENVTSLLPGMVI